MMSHRDRPPLPRHRAVTARGGIARAAALLVSLTAVSQLLGFVRDAVIAAVFGVGASVDAYLVAQGLMNLVLALVAGAVARAVVPPVSRAVAAGDLERSHRTVQTAVTVTVLVLLAGSVLMYAGAETVVTVLAPGFDAGTRELAATLTRVVLVATVFVALTNILAAVAQAHGRFFASGFQGVPFNLVMIVAALVFGERFGVQALAVGFVVGSAVRLLVQLPSIRKVGLRLRPRLALRDADVREVARLTPPLLVGSAVVNVNTLVDRAVGSSQGDGVISALSFGWRIVTLVDSLLVVTVVAALYPAFSAVGAPEHRGQLRDLVGRALRVMLVLLTPVVALLVVAAGPVVSLVFGRGDFGDTAVRTTATAVAVYAVSALGIAMRSVASRACLAVGDSRTPVIVAVVAMAVNVVGDLTLGIAYGITGLAASTSLSLVVAAVILLVLLGRRHDAVALHSLATSGARVLLAVGIAVAAVAVAGLVGAPGGGALLDDLVRVAVTGLLLLGVYAAALMALRGQEVRDVVDVVRPRLPARWGT